MEGLSRSMSTSASSLSRTRSPGMRNHPTNGSPRKNRNQNQNQNQNRNRSRLLLNGLSHVLLVIVLSTCLIDVSSGALTFLGWSDKCKIPSLNEFLRPNEECDSSRGLLCQKYSQGTYCGCQIGGPLTYDKQSKECRRKIASFCSYEPVEDIENNLNFNQKCHEWAECVKVNLTAVSGSKAKEDAHICKCREGYQASRDFSECERIKTSGGGASGASPLFVFLISALATAVYSLGRLNVIM